MCANFLCGIRAEHKRRDEKRDAFWETNHELEAFFFFFLFFLYPRQNDDNFLKHADNPQSGCKGLENFLLKFPVHFPPEVGLGNFGNRHFAMGINWELWVIP